MLPEFLNVDLEIESDESLDYIANEFGDKVFVLRNGPWRGTKNLLAVQVHETVNRDPDSIINVLCDLIAELSAKSKALWRRCEFRRFDVGIGSGTSEAKQFKALCLTLSPETLKRVSALSAEVAITVYSSPRAKPTAKVSR